MKRYSSISLLLIYQLLFGKVQSMKKLKIGRKYVEGYVDDRTSLFLLLSWAEKKIYDILRTNCRDSLSFKYLQEQEGAIKLGILLVLWRFQILILNCINFRISLSILWQLPGIVVHCELLDAFVHITPRWKWL